MCLNSSIKMFQKFPRALQLDDKCTRIFYGFFISYFQNAECYLIVESVLHSLTKRSETTLALCSFSVYKI